MKKYLSLLLAASIALCGCVYHPPVFQGNVLTPEKVEQIHNGMTPADVVATLGTPVLRNAYETNQITYIYTSQKASKKMEIKKLEIDFTNNRVSNVRKWL